MSPTWIALAAGLSLAVPAPKDPPPSKDPPIVGEWQVVASNGRERPSGPDGRLPVRRVRITADSLSIETGARKSVVRIKLIPPVGDGPAGIDWTVMPTTDSAPRTYRGIYRVRGDTLEIRMARTPDEDRPTSFDRPDKGPIRGMVLKRIKP